MITTITITSFAVAINLLVEYTAHSGCAQSFDDPGEPAWTEIHSVRIITHPTNWAQTQDITEYLTDEEIQQITDEVERGMGIDAENAAVDRYLDRIGG